MVFKKGNLSLWIPPVSFATPMTDEEYEWLTLAMPQNKIFQTEEIDTFKSGSYWIRCKGRLPEKNSAWAATWMVDASLKPANLTLQVANEQGVQQMELRCEPLRTNADWLKTLELKLSTSDRSKAKTCLEALETDGPTLEEIDLENRSTECLQALLKSMASRQDEVGARVRDALKDKKATPAQLQSLERDDLTEVLLQARGSSQYFPLNVSDLRWLPPVVVGRFIERKWGNHKKNSDIRSQSRLFLGEVLKASAPVGNGRVWPSSFVGGANRAAARAAVRPQSYTLNWLLKKYEATTQSNESRRMAANLLTTLEQDYSVVDFPRIADAAVSRDRLQKLFSDTACKQLFSESGFLGWLKSQNLTELQVACDEGRSHNAYIGPSAASILGKDLLLADHASWIKQVDDRLREEGHDPKLAVKVMQAWMQAHERRMTNPFVSPVFRRLKAHARGPEDFLTSVDADLAQWDAEIEQARTRVFEELSAFARPTRPDPADDRRQRLEGLVQQRRRLVEQGDRLAALRGPLARGEASPARATIERAFAILHSMANVEPSAEPPQAPPEAGPRSLTAGPFDGSAFDPPRDSYGPAWETSDQEFLRIQRRLDWNA